MKRRAFSLVEILVVMVVLGLLAAWLLPQYLGGRKNPASKSPGSPIRRAESTQCAENLRQIRMAYQMATAASDERPASLADLRGQGVSEAISRCPVSGQPYQFSPSDGRVRCGAADHRAL